MNSINLTTIDVVHQPEDFAIEPTDDSTRLPEVRATPSVSCDALNRVKVVDLINAINSNTDRLTIVENGFNNYISNFDGIKTRLDGNKLYMTNDGTNP